MASLDWAHCQPSVQCRRHILGQGAGLYFVLYSLIYPGSQAKLPTASLKPAARLKRREFRRQKICCVCACMYVCGFIFSFFLSFSAVFGTKLRWFSVLMGILLASLASVWLFSPSCMLTWESSFALAAIIVTQLTTPYIRIAPAAGDGQLTGQTFKYR